jgi:hypothetical protein
MKGKVFTNPGRRGKGSSSSSSSSSTSAASEEGDEMGGVVSVGAGEVVNCAGAFAAAVVDMCGDGVASLPVAARRRTVFSVQCETSAAGAAAAAAPRCPDAATTPLVVCPESGAYFRPDGMAPGRFLCGVSPPPGWPDPDDTSVRARSLSGQLQLFITYVLIVVVRSVPIFVVVVVAKR